MKTRTSLCCLFAIILLSGCQQKNPDKEFENKYKDDTQIQEERVQDLKKPSNPLSSKTMHTSEANQLTPPKKGEEIAIIQTNMGTMKMKFFKNDAPELSKNFIELAKSGYYDGLIFHRVIKGFMIQGGDPLGNGSGGHSYKGPNTKLDDEAGALALKHLPGSVACAKSSLPHSIGSQFYIVHKEASFLNGQYSVFGQVFEGLDVVDKIANTKTGAQDKPIEDVIIEKITLEIVK